MFNIKKEGENTIRISGRFDASQVDLALEEFDSLEHSSVVDFAGLDYISSAGIGVILATYKRLHDKGKKLKLINMQKLVRDVFRFSGLDRVFEIE